MGRALGELDCSAIYRVQEALNGLASDKEPS
jgi:hypothetical protein